MLPAGKRQAARPARPRTPSRTGMNSPKRTAGSGANSPRRASGSGANSPRRASGSGANSPRRKTGSGANSTRRTAGTVSDGDSPRQPASREVLTGIETDTGQAVGQVAEQSTDQPAQQQADQAAEQQTGQTSEQSEQLADPTPGQSTDQSPEQTPDQQPDHQMELMTHQTQDETPTQTQDQRQDQTPDQTSAKPEDQPPSELPDQTPSQRPEPSSKEWSTTPLGPDPSRGRPVAEDLDSEGRSVSSETTTHTDTETIDADEGRESLESEPFSSGPDDDEGSQPGPASTAASEGDSASVSSPRSTRRVSFDENAPETLMFTPEPGGGGRSSDEDGSVMTASTDSDSEESGTDSFRRLLELLWERSLTPIDQYSDEAGTSGLTVDPSGHVARYLREQHGRSTMDVDDESDIQEDEVHPYREERRPAFPNEPAPRERRSNFAETIDEFLHYLQAIAEDHKAHQEAMNLLDEEPLAEGGSDVGSEAGDSAWSETDSEMAESVGEAGSAQTEVDSGLATSPPPLEQEVVEDRRTDEGKVSVPVSGGSRAEADTGAQSGTNGEDVHDSNETGQSERHESNIEEDKMNAPVERGSDRNERQEANAAHTSKPNDTTDAMAPENIQTEPQLNSVVSPPSSAPPDDSATVKTGERGHSSDRSAGIDGSPNQPSSSKTIPVSSGGERDTGPAWSDTGPAPTDTGPAPTDTSPAPTDTGPTPTATGPASSDTSPAPTDTGPAPTDTGPAPTDTGPAPTDTSPAPTDTVPVAAANLPPAEHVTADPITSTADSSPTRSQASSRESSASDSRRGSAILRSLLRASLPAVEVLGSHSDTDTLQERRASLVAAGGLLPPTADQQARSPGQTGSLETIAKSPGEMSKQPSPADSGGASEAVSESELSHYQPVRSLASIADRLLRGDSEEEAPRVVPSGVGPANSMAAISGQLLTDHSPGEPAYPNDMAHIDEADDETELHSIIMHGEVAEHTADTGELEMGETEEGVIVIVDEETGKTDAKEVESGEPEATEVEAGEAEPGTAETEAGAAEVVEADTGATKDEEVEAGRTDSDRNETKKANDALKTDAREKEGEGNAEELEVVEDSHSIGTEAGAELNPQEAIERENGEPSENVNETRPRITSGETNDGKVRAIGVATGEEGNNEEDTNMEIARVDTNTEEVEEDASEATTKLAPEGATDQTASKTYTEKATLRTGMAETDEEAEERTEIAAKDKETIPIISILEQIWGPDINKKSEALDTAVSASHQNDQQRETAVEGINNGAHTSKNEEDEAHEIEQTSKEPEGSTSMTDGAPNIAIQTSTRLTLDVDGLGSVISDISKLVSYDSYYHDDGNGSENGSEHTDSEESQSVTPEKRDAPVDDNKAHLEALALLENDETDESSLQTTVRTYVREDDVMAGARKRNDPSDGIDDEREHPDSALSTGSADGPKESDSFSSLFSDVRSEVSEPYTTGSEMDEGTYRKDGIRLTSDGESVTTFDDDEIFESETVTRLRMLSSTGAKKLVWSLIAMASGIVEHVQGSETKINASKAAFSQPDAEAKQRSQVQFEETENNDRKTTDDSGETKEEGEMTDIILKQLKEVHSPNVKNIVKTAKGKVEESMKYEAHNSYDSSGVTEEVLMPDKSITDGMNEAAKEAERSNITIQLKEMNRPKVKEIVKTAEVQIQETMRYNKDIDDSGKATDYSMGSQKPKPDIMSDQNKAAERTNITKEQLKEIYKPQVKTIMKAAEVQFEETKIFDTKNVSGKTIEEVAHSVKTISDIVYDQITKEAEKSNVSIDHFKEMHGPQIKKIIKAAEDQVISAADTAISIIKQTLSRGLFTASGHEIVGGEENSYSSNEPEVKTFLETNPLASNHETPDVSQNLPVDLGHDDVASDSVKEGIQVGLENENIQDDSTHISSKGTSERSSEQKTDEKPFLLEKLTYEVIPKQKYEAVNLDTTSTGRSTEDLTELEPSPQDIASIAVAITQSVLGEASDIVEDEQTAARRLRVRKSIAYDRDVSSDSNAGISGSLRLDVNVNVKHKVDLIQPYVNPYMTSLLIDLTCTGHFSKRCTNVAYKALKSRRRF